ncbi:MAG TPA: universal stress protein [Phycisphaerales bacterium]|nr:universal stress protein [Phycisphaerales bacterium]
MYRTILIPLENSPTDEAILAHIRGLAKLCGSRLALVHVADGHMARNQKGLNMAESQEMRDDQAYLERRRAELARDGFDVEAHLECGDPSTQILALTKRINPDLIAMSTHGHGFVKDVVLGSVAEAVRHRTDVPVLLLRSRPVSGA